MRKLNQFSASSQQRAKKEINAMILLSPENSTQGGARPPFDLLNNTQNKVAQKTGRDTLVPQANHVKTPNFRSKPVRQSQLKSARRSPSFSFISLTTYQNTSSFLPGTLNTVNEVNPATLSSPYTHPSILGKKKVHSSGSLFQWHNLSPPNALACQ